MESAVDAPEQSSSDNGSDEPHSGPLTDNYVSRTISDAHDNIPESRYLEEKKEPKKKQAKPERVEDAPEEEDGPEPDTLEEDEVPEGDEEKRNQRWSQYRSAYKENSKLKATINDLQRQVEQLSDNTEVEKLRGYVQALVQERQELTHAVESGNVERSSKWKAEITTPLNRMWAHVQAIAKRNNLDAQRMGQMLNHGNQEALEEYMAETAPGDRHNIFGMLRELADIEEKKRELHENAGQLSAADQQEMMARRDAYYRELHGQRSAAIENMLPKLQERILAYMPKDKRPNLQGAVRAIMDYDNWKEDAKMYGGYAAIILPELYDSYRAVRLELKNTKNELARMRGGGPRATTGTRPGSAPQKGPTEDLSRPIGEITADMTSRIRRAAGFRA